MALELSHDGREGWGVAGDGAANPVRPRFAAPSGRDVQAVERPAVRREWRAKHPRFELHFTPTSSSWLNTVEIFFGRLTERAIRRGIFRSVPDSPAETETVHDVRKFLGEDAVSVGMEERIWKIIRETGRLPVDTASLSEDSDLYVAGMTSHASVNVMLALEDAFDIEFPDHMLKRSVFQSVSAISAAISGLVGQQVA